MFSGWWNRKVAKTFAEFRKNDYLCIVILINNLFTLKEELIPIKTEKRLPVKVTAFSYACLFVITGAAHGAGRSLS